MRKSAIKSAKFHLKRAIKNMHLTYEDMQIVLAQIESVPSSQPLSCLLTYTNNSPPLTPVHFLICRSLFSLPDNNLSETNQNRLQLFRRSQHISQCFWKHWKREVVSDL